MNDKNDIEKLINELNPKNIELVELDKLIEYIQPTKYIIESNNYNNDFKTPVLTPGKTFILGYTNDIDGIYNASNNPIILFDDFTTSFHWVDFDFKVKSSALKILINKDDKISNFKFLYYSMRNIKNETQDHTRQWISKYSKLKISLPPLEIQNKIVNILDNFQELTAELTAELSARKEQYHYYHNKLLTFDEPKTNNTQTHTERERERERERAELSWWISSMKNLEWDCNNI